jgi:hypothetical protein
MTLKQNHLFDRCVVALIFMVCGYLVLLVFRTALLP